MPLTKQKKKLNKLIQQTDSDDSEHELSFYINDRVKLMKEVLKTIRPKKIKAMSPACLKNMDMEEINSMLLEELLGISNKRLKYIFNGQNLDEESSSSTNEDDPVDIISLDDISDDEFVINIDDDTEACASKLKKVKREHKHTKVKREKERHTVKDEKTVSKGKEKHKDKLNTQAQGNVGIDSNENLMSVLELLELQARARAIKSQLLIENSKSQESTSEEKTSLNAKIESDDDVIIECAKTEEIIITSSESEDDTKTQNQKPKKVALEAIKKPSEQIRIDGERETDALNVIGETSTLQHSCNDKNCTNCSITENATDIIFEKVLEGRFENTFQTSGEEQSKSEETKIKIIENKEVYKAEDVDDGNKPSEKESQQISEKNGNEEKKDKLKQVANKEGKIDNNRKGKQLDNDETIVINLSDYEMEELK